ncbi:putative ankyrin repeat protein [Cotonvirus japonicus]|uniref:Ankyrin repeat protein n=1 Tax=Cotonvirus japonicus TaxID=2811091 RepID=A0ABM7NRN3_9VIRU|nr:putative ankyrin repeat protein [Cotonvirus japonicus]BCS82747.1 putative ankyrin repeat protein [Cotonvirus japonicus]
MSSDIMSSDIMSSDIMFLDITPIDIYCKILSEDFISDDYQYQMGLNVFDNKFQNGVFNINEGLYFTDIKNIFNFVANGVYFVEVTLPLNTKIIKDPDNNVQWIADKIVISNKRDLRDYRNIQYLIDKGATYNSFKSDLFEFVLINKIIEMYDHNIFFKNMYSDTINYGDNGDNISKKFKKLFPRNIGKNKYFETIVSSFHKIIDYFFNEFSSNKIIIHSNTFSKEQKGPPLNLYVLLYDSETLINAGIITYYPLGSLNITIKWITSIRVGDISIDIENLS